MIKKIFNVNLEHRPAIIAEIGLNHEGSIDKAYELISLAKEGGADAAGLPLHEGSGCLLF